jgi:hypothetical protein
VPQQSTYWSYAHRQIFFGSIVAMLADIEPHNPYFRRRFIAA